MTDSPAAVKALYPPLRARRCRGSPLCAARPLRSRRVSSSARSGATSCLPPDRRAWVQPAAAAHPTGPEGLSSREAERRLLHLGPNRLERRHGRRWPKQLARQFTHPLALLLWGAAVLAALAGITPVAIAVVVVIVLNAAFAFAQEHAGRARGRGAAGLPPAAGAGAPRRRRDRGRRRRPGPRRPAADRRGRPDLRRRAAARGRARGRPLDPDRGVGAGLAARRASRTRTPAACRRATSSSAAPPAPAARRGRWSIATGMGTELGRIAALSQRVEVEESPLEHQVRRVAWLIAGIAVAMGIAFVPLAAFGAGLSLSDAVVLAIGLIVGNVPEGLLPVITLALAVGVRGMVRRGRGGEAAERGRDARLDRRHLHRQDRHPDREPDAGDRRLERRSRRIDLEQPADRPTDAAEPVLRDARGGDGRLQQRPPRRGRRAASATRPRWRCCWPPRELGADVDAAGRAERRRAQFHFDPALKLMSTVDEAGRRALGARQGRAGGDPAALRPRSPTATAATGPLDDADRARRSRRLIDALRRRRPAGAGGRAARSRSATGPAAPRGGRARPHPARPGRDDRPAAAGGRRGGRALPPGRDPDHRRHRRPPATAAAIASADRHRRRRADGRHRGASSTRMSEAELDAPLREGRRADLRPQHPGGEAADRRRAARGGPRRRDDRRRRQRRAGPAPRRHRRRDGPLGHRRRPRGRDDGPHRRQLRDDRRRRRGGAADLRQHPQVHPLHLRPRDAGGRRRSSSSRSAAARSRCR